MTNFEDELRSALVRRDPPAGFEERVLAKINRTESRPARPRWWLAVAAAIILMSGGALEYQRRESKAAEKAGHDLLRALHVVNSELEEVRQRVTEIRR